MHNGGRTGRTARIIRRLCLTLPLLAAGRAAAQSAHTFTVRVANRTAFDVEIIDGSRLVERGGEKTVTLPRYAGEVDGGYPLTYRVPLANGVYIPVRRDENVVVKPGQAVLPVDAAVFEPVREAFVVLRNESPHTARVRGGAGYLLGLESAASVRRYGTANIAPGEAVPFDGVTPDAALAVEADRFEAVPFPALTYRPGYRYVFAFDGKTVELVDARPLHTVGLPVLAAVFFDGPQEEYEAVVRALDGALAARNAPVRTLPEGPAVSRDAEYAGTRCAFVVVTAFERKEGQPFAWMRAAVTGEITLQFMRGGRVLIEEKEPATEFDEAGLHRVLVQWLRTGADTFYRRVGEVMKDE
jgi:hypothetical protein